MTTHFTELCEYDRVHAQCRCIGPKTIRRIKCDNPQHVPAEVAYVGKHRKQESS